MRSNPILRCALAVCFTALLALFCAAPALYAQGGEPQYFAIRGAKVVPVSGPPVENATIVISRGLITAIGKDVTIPPEAWVIEGDRKSTRLNSSHITISYAVFCLKKKKNDTDVAITE